jgi:ribosomal protein S20
VEAGDQLDLATKAEVLLDALTQQISARKHQLQTEQLNWENLYEDSRVHSAVKRVVREVPSKHHSVRSSAFLCYWATTVIACVFGQNIVVRSYAKREVTSDEVITCILEVKVPTADATGGHDVFILNIVRRHYSFCYSLYCWARTLIRESRLVQLYWVLGLPTNEYGQRKDRIVRTQAYCRRAGDTTTEPALLFGYHQEIGGVLAILFIFLYVLLP